MESALIVSGDEKGAEFFAELLADSPICRFAAVQTCAGARKTLLDGGYDLMVVNAPLRDETGVEFAGQTASKGITQVILAVKSEFFAAVSAASGEHGVLTVPKPINRAVFSSAVGFAAAAQNRLIKIVEENARLRQKIEDIRVVDRAKCLLISYLKMSEQDAHRFMEKQAMDMRATRRQIAEGILKTYEN